MYYEMHMYMCLWVCLSVSVCLYVSSCRANKFYVNVTTALCSSPAHLNVHCVRAETPLSVYHCEPNH